ncbi:YggT family protein [uncultured Neptuniibacter sp.]|uniref:YggT family protein n=1 Tax=uncultured Neptuniibacter sp. TaxID=502143 RepID=UPI002621C610|nr:YggT family protein [uncultured Neptuniibacter sp.]
MAQDPIILIIRTLGEMYAFIVIIRFLLQISHADYYNPISQAIARLTNVPVLALSRVVPRIGRIDFSALLYAIAIKVAVLCLIVLFSEIAMPNLLQLAMLAIVGVIDAILTIYFWAVLGSVIISWVAPGSYHPGPQLIQQITEPLFNLARKVIPPIGGLDLSPILIFIVIQLIQSQLSRLLF